MNIDNDQTFRKIFIKGRHEIAFNDEQSYRQKYGDYSNKNIISRTKIFNEFYNIYSVDRTEKRIFKSEKIYPTSIENEPVIILHKFLGECSRYVKGLAISAKTIYMEWFGESNDTCDCCGRYRTILTSGSYRHYTYLCDRCADHFYKNDQMIGNKAFEFFPNLIP